MRSTITGRGSLNSACRQRDTDMCSRIALCLVDSSARHSTCVSTFCLASHLPRGPPPARYRSYGGV